MKLKSLLQILVTFIGVPVLLTTVCYLVNIRLFSANKSVSPKEPLLIEGIMSLILGILFLLGRGGINRNSAAAALISAVAGALSGRDTVGPDEQFERDAWRPKGFPKLALVLIISGFLMIVVYFLTLK
jgi:uncharacterized membrane protein HdeD (DUF308 family)